jgi:Uma2 family endonuclease
MSESDDLREARQKMEEYIDNGVQLAWLINRAQAQVLIFRIDGTVEKVDGFEQGLSGEGVLEGFEFDLGLLK